MNTVVLGDVLAEVRNDDVENALKQNNADPTTWLYDIQQGEHVATLRRILKESGLMTDAVASIIQQSDLSAPEMLVQVMAQTGSITPAGDVVTAYRVLEHLRTSSPNGGSQQAAQLIAAIGGFGLVGRQMNADLGSLVPLWACDTDAIPGMYAPWQQTDGKYIPLFDRKRSPSRGLLASAEQRKRIVEISRDAHFYTNMNMLGMTEKFSDFLALLQQLHDANVPIAFDTQWRPYVMERLYPNNADNPQPTEAFHTILQYVSLLFGGRDDLKAMYGVTDAANDTRSEIEALFSRCKKYCKSGAHIVIKADTDGAFWVAPQDDLRQEKVPNIHGDVHPGGAGDSFIGAFMYAQQRGLSVQEAVVFANEIATCFVQIPGAAYNRDRFAHLLREHAVHIP